MLGLDKMVAPRLRVFPAHPGCRTGLTCGPCVERGDEERDHKTMRAQLLRGRERLIRELPSAACDDMGPHTGSAENSLTGLALAAGYMDIVLLRHN
jgi:hypothetical protein